MLAQELSFNVEHKVNKGKLGWRFVRMGTSASMPGPEGALHVQVLDDVGEPAPGIDILMVAHESIRVETTDQNGIAVMRLFEPVDVETGLHGCTVMMAEEPSDEVSGVGQPLTGAIDWHLVFQRSNSEGR